MKIPKLYGIPLNKFDKKLQEEVLKISPENYKLPKVVLPITGWRVRKDGAIIIPEFKGWGKLKFRILFWYYTHFKKGELIK